jgi:hypothetical protein
VLVVLGLALVAGSLRLPGLRGGLPSLLDVVCGAGVSGDPDVLAVPLVPEVSGSLGVPA